MHPASVGSNVSQNEDCRTWIQSHFSSHPRRSSFHKRGAQHEQDQARQRRDMYPVIDLHLMLPWVSVSTAWITVETT